MLYRYMLRRSLYTKQLLGFRSYFNSGSYGKTLGLIESYRKVLLGLFFLVKDLFNSPVSTYQNSTDN